MYAVYFHIMIDIVAIFAIKRESSAASISCAYTQRLEPLQKFPEAGAQRKLLSHSWVLIGACDITLPLQIIVNLIQAQRQRQAEASGADAVNGPEIQAQKAPVNLRSRCKRQRRA